MRRAAGHGLLWCLTWLALAGATQGAEHEGRAIYETRCYYCHGYAGDARTAAADVLQPPPRDFTALSAEEFSTARMLAAVRDGRPGTAMQGFATLLDEREIDLVVDYVRTRFVGGGRGEARYHSPGNGWSGSPQDSPAAPWVLGQRSLEERWESLAPTERDARRLFLQTCISCHTPVDRAGTDVWRNLAISYPTGNYVEIEHEHDTGMEGEPTAVFERHEEAPELLDPDPVAQRGRALYLRACAACHAGNGSGRNWVGSFIDPPPPDLRDAVAASVRTRAELLAVLRGGVPGSSMPAFAAVLGEPELASLTRYFEVAFRPLAD